MRTDCNTIRREIDEANLDDRLTAEATEHLRGCDECRRFHDDRHTLRGLMAELETVGAPADFDFRLRARLARERPSNGFGSLLLTARPLAALALVILIAVVAVVVKSRFSLAGNPPLVSKTASKEGGPTSMAVPKTNAPQPASKDTAPTNVATMNSPHVVAPVQLRQKNEGKRSIVPPGASEASTASARRTLTRDSAGTGAAMITADPFGGLLVVPVDARAFKLSIDNGRGGARTISLPPVSFGSQRLLAREASFVPVSSTRGDW